MDVWISAWIALTRLWIIWLEHSLLLIFHYFFKPNSIIRSLAKWRIMIMHYTCLQKYKNFQFYSSIDFSPFRLFINIRKNSFLKTVNVHQTKGFMTIRNVRIIQSFNQQMIEWECFDKRKWCRRLNWICDEIVCLYNYKEQSFNFSFEWHSRRFMIY